MDLSAYKNFIAVAECGNYTKATEKTHIAQPALSVQVKSFEKLYDVKLIKTKPGIRNIELTEEGKIFLQHAKALCHMYDNITEEMQSLKSGSSGILRLSTSASRAVNVVSHFLVPFSSLYPNVEFEIIEDILPNLEQNVLNNITELAISNTPLHTPHHFDILHRIRENIYAVFSENAYFFDKDKEFVTIKELEKYPLSLSKGSSVALMEAMKVNGCMPQILAKTSSRQANLAWAHSTKAIAIIPMEEEFAHAKGLRFLPIKNENFYTEKIVFKLANKKLSPLAQKFLEFYLKQYEQISS